MTESSESGKVESLSDLFLDYIASFIGLILGAVSGFISKYIAVQPYALAYPASGWELNVLIFTFISALLGLCLALMVAGIVRTISKPYWWIGALIGGLVSVIGIALWAFYTSPDNSKIPYSDHEGFEGRAGSTHCKAYGWAADPDDRRRDLKIRILADDDPVPVATTVADLTRGGLRICTGGTCGFNVNLSGLISAGETHQITVQAYDLETESWVDLDNTPKVLTCSD